MLDKHKYLRGNPLLERERIKNMMIDAIIAALQLEGVTSIPVAAVRIDCSRNQVRYIYRRLHNNISLSKLADCCDALNLRFSFNDILGRS